ncbi:hypothetical protein [Paracoccus sp. ME4]|uniref:hypothetical protein n=1 Tax=Paracoccus sp. ME4 TaxID=3138066 RepID=UPI00398AF97D
MWLLPSAPRLGPIIGLGLLIGTAAAAQQPLGDLVIEALPLQSGSGDAVQVLTALPAPDGVPPVDPAAPFDMPRPLRPGGPVPSVVVGDWAVLMTAGPRGELGLPHAAREAIRARDPAIFARLLEQGAFDPPQDRFAAALQQELARLGCYGGGVDGAWGPGSAAALARYAAAGGPVAADADPDRALFRAVLAGPDIACPAPAPVAAAPARQPAASPAQPAATARARPQSANPPAAAAAPEAPRTGRRIGTGGLLGSGVIR